MWVDRVGHWTSGLSECERQLSGNTNDRLWRAPCKGGAFPVGANPTRQPLQPEATGANVEATKR